MEFDVDLAQETSPNDLPDEPQNEMLADFDDIATSNIDDGAANPLGRVDDDVIILGHVKSIQNLDLFAGLIQDTLVDRIGDTVIDQLGQNQAIFALVEHFKGVGRKGKFMAYVRIAGKNGIDVPRELGSLILIDGMGGVGGGTLEVDCFATYASLRDMTGTRGMSLNQWGRDNIGRRLGVFDGRTKLGDELSRGVSNKPWPNHK